MPTYYYEGYSIDCDKSGTEVKLFCPKCNERGRKHKLDRPLQFNTRSYLFKCHCCDWKGKATERPDEQRNNTFAPPAPATPGAETAPQSRPIFYEGKMKLCDDIVRYFSDQRSISQEVLTRMKITQEEAYIPNLEKRALCIGFNYFENGELVNTKYRTLDKHFASRTGARSIPYNIDAIAHTKECVIVEGECDALSFIQIGYDSVISVPNGANSNLEWMNPYVESHLENKEIIYIASDMDEKGMMLRYELVRRLGKERCRIVTFAKGCKDANDQLVQQGEESLRACLAAAPEQPLEGVFTVKEVKDEYRTLFEEGVGNGLSTGFDNLDTLLRLETGRLCVVTGIPNCGKSEFIDMIAVQMNMLHDWKTVFFSPENLPLQMHFAKHSEKFLGKAFKKGITTEEEYQSIYHYLQHNIFSIVPEEGFTVDNILQKAREVVRRKGVKMVVIDPFNRIDHQMEKGMAETQYISHFLDRLLTFAINTGTLVVLVAHPRKLERDNITKRFPVPDMYSINGSANFFNKCDYGFAVEREENSNLCTVHIQKVRFRNLGKCGQATFAFNLNNGRYAACEVDKAPNGGLRPHYTPTLFDNSNWLLKKQAQKEAAAQQLNIGFK